VKLGTEAERIVQSYKTGRKIAAATFAVLTVGLAAGVTYAVSGSMTGAAVVSAIAVAATAKNYRFHKNRDHVCSAAINNLYILDYRSAPDITYRNFPGEIPNSHLDHILQTQQISRHLAAMLYIPRPLWDLRTRTVGGGNPSRPAAFLHGVSEEVPLSLVGTLAGLCMPRKKRRPSRTINLL
jgi:uncharacterized membrane protein